MSSEVRHLRENLEKKVAERTQDLKATMNQLHDAQDALVELTTGDVAYGYYNMTILALGTNQREVNRCADIFSSTLRAVSL